MRSLVMQILGVLFLVTLFVMLPVGMGWLISLVVPFTWFESSVVAGIGLATLLVVMMLYSIKDYAKAAMVAAFPGRIEIDDDDDDEDDVFDDNLIADVLRRSRMGQAASNRREQRKRQRLARKQQRKG